MSATVMDFLDDTYRVNAIATVKAVGEGRDWVQLDRTIFYPQGGGQPTDKGYIRAGDARFRVDKVDLSNGVIFHRGAFEQGQFEVDATVDLEVHLATRIQNAKMHTGGHLIMTAVDAVRQMKAVKGYHFPDGPYVEFQGAVPEGERTNFMEQVQSYISAAIERSGPVQANLTTRAQLEADGVYIPMEIPRDKPTRVVTTAGYQSPCGGTHVATLGELKGLKIRSLKVKGGNTRLSYTIE